MQKKVLISITLLIISTACSPSSPTGMTVTESVNETEEKATKFTVPDQPPPSKPPVNATQTCKDQIKELKEQKVEDEYNLLLLEGKQQKLSMEIQFKKQNQKFEEEVEEMVDKLQKLSKEVKELKNDIDAKKDAIRLLEEKCNLKK